MTSRGGTRSEQEIPGSDGIYQTFSRFSAYGKNEPVQGVQWIVSHLGYHDGQPRIARTMAEVERITQKCDPKRRDSREDERDPKPD